MSALQKLIALERETATLGFDWPNINAIIDQIISESDEIRQVLKLNEGKDRLQEEAGDLLHAAVSLCVFENLDVEQTLAEVAKKFESRLQALQMVMKQHGYSSLSGESFDFLLELWGEAKTLADTGHRSSKTKIRPFKETDIPVIVDSFAACGWKKPASIFEAYYQENLRDERLVWVAFYDDKFAGYVTLKWVSSYDPFKENIIPEIKDLNVLPAFREQGIGSELLDIAEEAAKTRGDLVGIGVGLYEGYGVAQKLYINRGYSPDGKGVTYNYQSVKPGTSVCVDDELILWFTKNLV